MAALSDYSSRRIIDWLSGRTAMPALPTPFLALFTATGADDGTGFTEVTGGAYARRSVSTTDFAAAAGSAPSTAVNANQLAFVTATADWGVVTAFGVYDAATAGNLLIWDFLGAHVWRPFSGTLASPAALTAPAHGFANSDSVVVTAEFGGALPATAGSWAGIKTVGGVTADTFTAGVNSTGTGSGLVRKVSSQSVANGVQVLFNASSLTIALG